jgi:hypothetical protein
VNAIGRELKEVPAVEGSAGIGGARQPAHGLTRLRIEGLQMRADGRPGELAVVGHAADLVGIGKGSVFAQNFRWFRAGFARLLGHDLGLPQRAARDE